MGVIWNQISTSLYQTASIYNAQCAPLYCHWIALQYLGLTYYRSTWGSYLITMHGMYTLHGHNIIIKLSLYLQLGVYHLIWDSIYLHDSSWRFWSQHWRMSRHFCNHILILQWLWFHHAVCAELSTFIIDAESCSNPCTINTSRHILTCSISQW